MSFHDSYEIVPVAGCWIWMRCLNDSGYGKVWSSNARKVVRAHRVSWELHNGEIPAGLNVLHRCDVPCCVNPHHLFLGTQQENARDMTAKGRAFVPPPQIGEKHGCAKLSEKAVRAIRLDGRSNQKIAVDYGINKNTVQKIKARATWRHL